MGYRFLSGKFFVSLLNEKSNILGIDSHTYWM